MRIRICAAIVAVILLSAVWAEAGDRDTPTKIVKAYWKAVMSEDPEGAWEVVSDKSRSEISEEQFISRQEEIAEEKLYNITEVVIGDIKERKKHTVVYITLKTTTPFGPRETPGSSKVVKENGQWGYILSKKFIASAKKL